MRGRSRLSSPLIVLRFCRLLGGFIAVVIFVTRGRKRIALVKPASEIDLAAALAAKRRRIRGRRVELLAANGTNNVRHKTNHDAYLSPPEDFFAPESAFGASLFVLDDGPPESPPELGLSAAALFLYDSLR